MVGGLRLKILWRSAIMVPWEIGNLVIWCDPCLTQQLEYIPIAVVMVGTLFHEQSLLKTKRS